MGILITPMALVLPLLPNKSGSRNKRGKLRVGWCISSWRSWFWPMYSINYIHTIYYSRNLRNWKALSKRHTYQTLAWPCWYVRWFDTAIVSCFTSNIRFNCIVKYALYHNIDISTMWHCALVRCTPSESTGLFWGNVRCFAVVCNSAL